MTSSILWRVCWIACLTALAVAAIDWGLPSPAVDNALFATRPTWDGKTLAAFDAERVDAATGADVDRDPLPRSTDPVELNTTDADRAAIVRRYRLFSHQPDEMITFMALQQMNPAAGQFDPRLYQYGGAWIYPVGGLLKLASVAGFVDLRADKAFYYDHPDAFGRFYVVARFYTLAAYVLTMTLAGMIVWRLTSNEAAAAAGVAVVGTLPVVFALAHEAKPHLAGTALVLATALAAARWLRTGKRRDAVLCGGCAGLAGGMVLSAVVAWIIPVAMAFLTRPVNAPVFNDSPTRRLAALFLAMAAAAFAFAATNPYLVLHAVRQDAVLLSNLGNTKAMYAVGGAAAVVTDGGRRLVDALSWPAAALAVGGLVVAVTRRRQTSSLGVLLAIPTVLVLLQFVAFAAGKPAEYARFALLPAAVLGVLGVWAMSTIAQPWLRMTAFVAAPLAIGLTGTWPYVTAFAADVTAVNTRTRAADVLRRTTGSVVQVKAEPAPYSVPPVDLWAKRLLLTPPNSAPTGDVSVRAIDDPDALAPPPPGYRRQIIAGDRAAPITWANKPFEVLVREPAAGRLVPSPGNPGEGAR